MIIRFRSLASILGAAVCSFVLVANASVHHERVDAAALATGDITKLPQRVDVRYTLLPDTAVKITPQQAVNVAEQRFDLTDQQIDVGIGVVRAVLSVTGMPGHQYDKAWVVTADDPIRAPGNGLLYQKLCVAVDAVTGQVLYAFSVDPTPSP
jgi:methionine-rich copper-binding protein CopC